MGKVITCIFDFNVLVVGRLVGDLFNGVVITVVVAVVE